MNKIIEDSGFQAIKLDILKSHLRIAHSIEDEYLKKIINMATNIFEASINQAVLKRKYSYTLIHNKNSARHVFLPSSPVTKISSVNKIIDKSTKQKLTFLEQNENNTKYVTIFGSKFPIEIQYYAGMFDSLDSIPQDIQYAVLQISKDIYESNNENPINSSLIKQIINSYKPIRLN